MNTALCHICRQSVPLDDSGRLKDHIGTILIGPDKDELQVTCMGSGTTPQAPDQPQTRYEVLFYTQNPIRTKGDQWTPLDVEEWSEISAAYLGQPYSAFDFSVCRYRRPTFNQPQPDNCETVLGYEDVIERERKAKQPQPESEVKPDSELIDWLSAQDVLSLEWTTPDGVPVRMTIDPIPKQGTGTTLRQAMTQEIK